ncbi:MAG: methionine ABC transporter permease [Actinomycetaceae bacterium]|nr:ABC transporter permease [Actinomycetaceae bacterium]MDY6083108.1 methionine ABC transporter permease [Actinomycetaceae bacterium]
MSTLSAACAALSLPSVLPFDGTWFSNPVVQQELWPATLETLYMTLVSVVFSVVFGLLIGLLLTATRPDGLFPHAVLYSVLGFIVNVGRSIPFVILMFVLIPFSRMVVGTATGWQGASVPLTVAAIPYFARLVESNLSGVESGKVEAAEMMGASRTRILFSVLVREALPTLIQSTTILTITLIGYTAMAGTVGGGGLGALAVNYGYYQWMPDVLTIIVVLIVAFVAIVQVMGDMLSRLVDHR